MNRNERLPLLNLMMSKELFNWKKMRSGLKFERIWSFSISSSRPSLRTSQTAWTDTKFGRLERSVQYSTKKHRAELDSWYRPEGSRTVARLSPTVSADDCGCGDDNGIGACKAASSASSSPIPSSILYSSSFLLNSSDLLSFFTQCSGRDHVRHSSKSPIVSRCANNTPLNPTNQCAHLPIRSTQSQSRA